jgi:tetratricopeptide (TPR) repeat protein
MLSFWLRTPCGQRGLARTLRAVGAAAVCAVGAHAQDSAQDSPPVEGELETDTTVPEIAADQRIVTRFEAEIEMRRLTDEERYAEAEEIGQQLIPLTEAEFGPTSLEAAAAHTNLAALQNQLEEYPAAEASYLQALSIYREIEGSYARVVIEPLLGLGDNYHDSGQYSNAISAYNEARTVSRRVDGLLNQNQMVMLDRMTASFERLDQHEEAHKRQLEVLALAERNYDPADPEMLEAIYRYAAWLRSANRYPEEREQYFRVERVIREHHGDDSLLHVRPLRERAISFRVQGNAAPQGIGGLRDALAMLEAQPEPDPLMLAEVLRDIGDWDVAFGRVGTDGADYLRSWRALGEVPNGAELREDWYESNAFAFNAPWNRRNLSNDPEAPRGHVLVRFDVDQYGRSHNVVVVSSEPPGLKDDAIARYIRESRFRPRIVDGQIVYTSNKALDVIFRYIPDEDEQQQD